MHKNKLSQKVSDEKTAFDKQWASERAQRALIDGRKDAELQAERVRPSPPAPLYSVCCSGQTRFRSNVKVSSCSNLSKTSLY
jgi:hypothetical protein